MRDCFIKKEVFMNIMMWLENFDGRVPTPAILKPEPLWTGKQIFGLFIPNINVKRQSAWHQDNEMDDFSLGDTQVSREQLVVRYQLYKQQGCHELKCSYF
jgi:DNA-directed RNA polymerase II subunit RPB1